MLLLVLFPLSAVGLRLGNDVPIEPNIVVDDIEINKNPTFLHAATAPLQPMAVRYVAGQEDNKGKENKDNLAMQAGDTANGYLHEENVVVEKCKELRDHEPEMKRQTWDPSSLYLHTQPLEAAHIFYRFHGKSRHDGGNQHTPVLGAISFLGSLQRLSAVQRGSVNVYVFVDSGISSDVRKFWAETLNGLGLETFQILHTESGNVNSYQTVLATARKVKDTTRAMMFFLEEDYLCHPDMMLKLFDFWSVYNPCFAVPYDYPDRYTRTDNNGYGHETILKTPFRHWRTVESTTATYLTRLDVFHILDKQSLLPNPNLGSSRGVSRQIRDLIGVWGPMPSLASHRHRDNTIQTDSDFDYEKFEEMLDKIAQQTPMRG